MTKKSKPSHPEEGDICADAGCGGKLEFKKDPRCCCNTTQFPPCSYCVPFPLVCDFCGFNYAEWTAEDMHAEREKRSET